jgi:DNA-binding transcriptional regulator YhcF (GntR family)
VRKDHNTLFLSWLEQKITSSGPGARLPTDSEIIKKFGISRSTVYRLLKPYCESGVLSRIPGKGTFVGGPPADDREMEPVKSSAQSIADTLYESIRDGDFKVGEALPQIKYIRAQFKVDYHTAVKAYRLLQDKGLVTKAGKTFWVGNVKEIIHPPGSGTICLFNYNSDDFTNAFDNNVLGAAYRSMTMELLSRGYKIIYENSRNLEPLAAGWKKSGNIPAGLFFCRLTGDYFQALLPAIRRVRRLLGPLMPPMELDWQIGFYKKELPGTEIFVQGNILTTASSVLADFIVKRGYKKVALFMHAKDYMWSFPNTSFMLYTILWETVLADPAIRTACIVKPKNRDRKHERWLREYWIPRQVIVFGKRFTPNPDRKLAERVTKDTVFTQDFAPLYQQYRDCSLWIFPRDSDAAAAIRWARERNINIPDDLSVIGLQSDPRYYSYGLTYCGPDWHTIGYQMAHALIRDFPVARTGKGFIRTSALMVERITTR